jgi:hypothetical protein
MEIVDDQSAVSPILGAGFGLSGLEFNFPETCDSSLYPENTAGAENLLLEQAGYEISFTGGVKSVSKSGSYYVVVLETCDNPAEELVKSVKLVGKAPPRDKSYYNILGNVSVAIAPNMKVPAERDTIQGTALDLIANPTSAVGVKSSPGANSIGYATNWQPQPKSCMQPPKKGGPLGNFGIIGAIVGAIALVIITIYCAPCAFALSQLYIGGFAATTAVGVVTATTVVAGAGAGYMAGSQIEKE